MLHSGGGWVAPTEADGGLLTIGSWMVVFTLLKMLLMLDGLVSIRLLKNDVCVRSGEKPTKLPTLSDRKLEVLR